MINFGKKDKKAALKVVSSLCANLAAGWYALVVIVPNFSFFKLTKDILVLILNLVFGSIFLGIAIILERKSL